MAFLDSDRNSKVAGVRPNPWNQHNIEQRYPQLTQDLQADVVVIGAGVSGLTTAYRLAKAGKQVVVLEGRVRGAGDAGRSLGVLGAWNDDYYHQLEGVVGRDRARTAAKAQQAAIGFIQQLIKEENIKCDFDQVPGYLFAHERGEWPDAEGQQKVKKELDACSRLGVDARMEKLADDKSLPSGIQEALVFNSCATLNPVKYLDGLAEAVQRYGGQIFENTRAKGGVVTGPSKGRVQTFTGHTVTAREGVVLATNSPINRDQVWVHDRQLPRRTYIIAVEVPAGSVQKAQFWDTAPNPHFVRVVPGSSLKGLQLSISSGKDLLLVQGEAHHHGFDKSKYWDAWGQLEKWTRRRFPQAEKVAYAWSSMTYQPADLLGLYGQDPIDFSNPPNYILTGHSGQQWTGATIGSEIIAGMITRKGHPWGDTYKPSRVVPNAVARYGTELTQYFATVGAAILKHVVPRSADDVRGFLSPSSVESQLQPGEGVVAQHGLRKKALYRDYDGTLHIKSAVCTHLGCCVEWNPLDKTFDCPCHGSEFDACGRCIHAPAVADLEDLGTKPATAAARSRT